MLHNPIITPRKLRRAVSYAKAEEMAAHGGLTVAQARVKVATENRVRLEALLDKCVGEGGL